MVIMAGKDTSGYTDDQIAEAIPQAVADHDFRAVIGLVHMLARRDPERARRILAALNLSIDVARTRA